MQQIEAELRMLDQSPGALRRFGLTVGLPLLLLGLLLVRRQRTAGWPFVVIGAVVLLLACAAPRSLGRFQRVWMTVAFTMGWIITNVILTVVFYLVVTPISVLQRLFASRPLDLSFDRDASTYWEPRTPGERSPPDYEKQY